MVSILIVSVENVNMSDFDNEKESSSVHDTNRQRKLISEIIFFIFMII